MITPVCLHNRRVSNSNQKDKKQQKFQIKQAQHNPVQPSNLPISIQQQKQVIEKPPQKEAKSIFEAFKSRIFWISIFTLLVGSSGSFMISANYKTYVKSTIQDDQFLTIIGVIGAVGNGCSRFLWNFFFSKTGYKTTLLSVLAISVVIFSTIRFTTSHKQAYLVEIFLVNVCLGGFLVTTPTVSQYIYGQTTGANIYCFFWENFALANMIGYIYVSQISKLIWFDNVIYVSLGMCLLAIPLVIFTTYQGPWKNDTIQLEYLVHVQMGKGKQPQHDTPEACTVENLANLQRKISQNLSKLNYQLPANSTPSEINLHIPQIITLKTASNKKNPINIQTQPSNNQ